MKLACRCGKPLTRDICPTKKDNFMRIPSASGCPVDDALFRPGFFSVVPAEPTSKRVRYIGHVGVIMKRQGQRIRVSQEDLVVEIPEMPAGSGCCNYSHGHPLECCSREIGEMYFDCYEEKFIDFWEDAVVRVY